jgi:SAM-dependent methyltransferase
MNLADYHAGLNRLALQPGPRILQSLRFGDTDEAHVRALLDAMQPAPFTHWLDVGCGYGEVARLMKSTRRDLAFTLVNSNAAQLRQAPTAFRHVLGDMEALPLEDAAYDGAMYLYSLCHATDPLAALHEAARVVRPGGALFVFDHARLRGDNAEAWQRLHSCFYPAEAWQELASRVGWRTVSLTHPVCQEASFLRDLLLDEVEMWDRVFADLVPMLWRCERR